MNLPKLLDMKFLTWQMESGGRRTVAEFAEWIGLPQSTLSTWWSGKFKPTGDKVKILANKLGPEVYDALDLPRPDPDLHYLQAHWLTLPGDARRAICDIVDKYKTGEND